MAADILVAGDEKPKIDLLTDIVTGNMMFRNMMFRSLLFLPWPFNNLYKINAR